MQINKTKFSIFEFLSPLKENRFFVILLLFLLIGMFFGAISVAQFENNYFEFLEKLITSFVSYKSNSSFIQLFFSFFIKCISLIFIIIISAFGICGIPLLPIIIFMRGFTVSIISGMLYRQFSLQGIAFADLILLPSCLALNFVLLYLSSNAMSLSWEFVNVLRDCSSRGIVIKPKCIFFLQKSLKCMFAVIFISVADSALSLGFIKYFNFY